MKGKILFNLLLAGMLVGVALTCSSSLKGQEIVSTSAVWFLNEKQGDTAKDNAEAHDGLIHGCTMGHPGIHHTCFWFDGDNDYISVNHAEDIDFGAGQNFSVFAWIKTNQSGVNGSILDKRVYLPSLSDYDGYYLGIWDDGSVVASIHHVGQTEAIQVVSTSQVTDDVWHNVCMVRSGDQLKIYVDGINENVSEGASGDIQNEHQLYIGSNTRLESDYMGFLDLIHINLGAYPDSDILFYYEHEMVIPGAPRNLNALSQDGQIDLDWLPAIGNTGDPPNTNYKIYRGTTAHNLAFYDIIGPDIPRYSDSNVSNGQTYYYSVTTVNGAGESNHSNNVNATAIASSDNGIPGFEFWTIIISTIVGLVVITRFRQK